MTMPMDLFGINALFGSGPKAQARTDYPSTREPVHALANKMEQADPSIISGPHGLANQSVASGGTKSVEENIVDWLLSNLEFGDTRRGDPAKFRAPSSKSLEHRSASVPTMLRQQVDGVGIHGSERQPHVKQGSRLIGDAGFFNALTDHLVSEEDISARSSQGTVVVKIISAEFLPQLTQGPCDVFARLQYGNESGITSTVRSVSPIWEQVFRFDYLDKQDLHVQIFQKNAEGIRTSELTLKKFSGSEGLELGFLTLRHEILCNNSADLGTWLPLSRKSPLKKSHHLAHECPRLKISAASHGLRSKHANWTRRAVLHELGPRERSEPFSPSPPLICTPPSRVFPERGLSSSPGFDPKSNPTAFLPRMDDMSVAAAPESVTERMGSGHRAQGHDASAEDETSEGKLSDRKRLLAPDSRVDQRGAHLEQSPTEVTEGTCQLFNRLYEQIPRAVKTGTSADVTYVCVHCQRNTQATFLKCGKCRNEIYCSSQCVAEHWDAGHRLHCQVPLQAGVYRQDEISNSSSSSYYAFGKPSNDVLHSRTQAQDVPPLRSPAAHIGVPKKAAAQRLILPLSVAKLSPLPDAEHGHEMKIRSVTGRSNSISSASQTHLASEEETMRGTSRGQVHNEGEIVARGLISSAVRVGVANLTPRVLPIKTSPRVPRVLPIKVSPLNVSQEESGPFSSSSPRVNDSETEADAAMEADARLQIDDEDHVDFSALSRKDLVSGLKSLLARAKDLSGKGKHQAAEKVLRRVAKYSSLLSDVHREGGVDGGEGNVSEGRLRQAASPQLFATSPGAASGCGTAVNPRNLLGPEVYM